MRLRLALPSYFYSDELEMLFLEEPFAGYAESAMRYEGNRCWIEVSYSNADSGIVDRIARGLMMEGYIIEIDKPTVSSVIG